MELDLSLPVNGRPDHLVQWSEHLWGVLSGALEQAEASHSPFRSTLLWPFTVPIGMASGLFSISPAFQLWENTAPICLVHCCLHPKRDS